LLGAVVRVRLPEDRPETVLTWRELMLSTLMLAKRHALLRESALLGALLFAGFSAFWTTLVSTLFLLGAVGVTAKVLRDRVAEANRLQANAEARTEKAESDRVAAEGLTRKANEDLETATSQLTVASNQLTDANKRREEAQSKAAKAERDQKIAVAKTVEAVAQQATAEKMQRRATSERLLAYKERGRWVDLDAASVNEYLRERTGEDLTAKDFRTWHATVLAAAALAESIEPGDSKASRRRAVKAMLAEVSDFLGNTPAIARSSYVDPRVIDLYEDGVTIAAATRRRHRDPDRRQAALERAVRRMLAGA